MQAVAGPQKLQHRRRTGFSHSGFIWELQQCSPLEQSAWGVFQDNSRCPSGMLTLMQPVQLVPEKIMQKTLYDHHTSISIGGRPIYNTWFADDINLMGGSNVALQDLTVRLVDRATAHGMEDGTDISKIKYLGVTLCKENTCSAEVRIRIASAMTTD